MYYVFSDCLVSRNESVIRFVKPSCQIINQYNSNVNKFQDEIISFLLQVKNLIDKMINWKIKNRVNIFLKLIKKSKDILNIKY